MKSFKKVLALVLVAAMLFTFAACGKNKGDDLSSEFTENNTVYKIGVSGPLTGGAAVYGVAVKNAAQMAIDEINAKGGLD